jgi:methylenetetrahydrofolate dehydrogenase (NADP+) / methenyltetrahydrofolate cyclohydrolase / formyltetrahydrofolate synthetase
MTVAMLVRNTVASAERAWRAERERREREGRVVPLRLDVLERVPRWVALLFEHMVVVVFFRGRTDTLLSDIEIAVAQTPKPITALAEEIGVKPEELESYGRYKAKVELSILERLKGRKNGKYVLISG